jgi:uncharacterized membrane protein required for colicin V production
MMETFDALQSFMAFGIVLVCIGLGGFAGLRLGLFRAVISFASLTAAAVSAIAVGEWMGGWLETFAIPHGWSLLFGYAAVFGVTLVVLPALVGLTANLAVISFPMLIDRIGGVLVGAFAGLLLASIVRVGFAMAPLNAAARPSAKEMQYDATPRLFQLVSRIMTPQTSERRAWLYGAKGVPFGEAKGSERVIWSEPFVDENENDRFDRDEPFLDKDENGEFTSQLRAGDLDPAKDPLIGVMERYWLGNWRLVRVEEDR